MPASSTPVNVIDTVRTMGSTIVDDSAHKSLQQSLEILNNATQVPKIRKNISLPGKQAVLENSDYAMVENFNEGGGTVRMLVYPHKTQNFNDRYDSNEKVKQSDNKESATKQTLSSVTKVSAAEGNVNRRM